MAVIPQENWGGGEVVKSSLHLLASFANNHTSLKLGGRGHW